jgi:2-octaprenyl-3-methyl-6-methoxy-1,4-benzoquinol hydroxylase
MGEHSARLTLDSGAVIEARLVVAADGADSAVRKQAGIAQQVWDYGQQGIVSVVRTDRPNPGIAWQRFMPGGPLAFLPLADGQSSIVWTRPGAEADGLIMLDDAAFLQVLNAAGWARCWPAARAWRSP